MAIPNAAPTVFTITSIEDLRLHTHGEVILPHDDDYDAARQAWNLSVDQHPAVILVAANAMDVVGGIQFAQANNLGIAVQSTGHGVIRHADDCLLIVTSQLSNVTVDKDSQTAWVEAGAIWGAVLEKAQAVGLAPLLGSSSGVGAIGYTLGGGMGWLARKYGLSADSVLEFEVVTPDGQLRRASAAENADLFWALGGGGKAVVGVVTAMRIRLYPVTTVYAGSVYYPIEKAKEVFAFYRDWIRYLPDEWTTSIAIIHFPPVPELPPVLSGQSLAMVTGCYSGDDLKVGQMMAQALSDWMEPVANTFRVMPLTESDTISNDPYDPVAAHSSGAWLNDLSDETIDVIIAHAGSRDGAFVKTEVRYAGGAIARVPVGANAYGHRSETLIMQCIGITPTPDAKQRFEDGVAAFKRALGSHLSGAVYINFLEGEEAQKETINAYTAEKYRRLTELKAKYDPNNVFHFGLNIPPVERA